MTKSFALLILSGVIASASPVYSVDPIPISIFWSVAGINDSGQIGGYAQVNGSNVAFIATTSGYSQVPIPQGWTLGAIEGINDSGQVVGFGYNGTTDQVFIGTTTGSTAVPLPSGWTSATAGGISDSGQVTGTGLVNGADQAFVGTTSASTAVPLPAGSTGSLGSAVNSFGQIAGTASPNPATSSWAFIGTASGSTVVPLPSTWTSNGFAINDAGEVAGATYNFTTTQAFVGTAAGYTLIPLPAGASAAYLATSFLNDSGVVVGGSSVGGWIWDATDGTQLLNTLVPSGWTISYALSISNNGLILAEGSYDDGPIEYLELSPSPEPAAGVLAGVGALLLVFAKRFISAA